MKTKIIYYISLILIVTAIACKKDKSTPKTTTTPPPPPVNEEELITTVKLLFTDSATNAMSSFTFEDADGDGGNPGAFSGTNQSDSVINLSANKTYSLQILFLDVTKNPIDTISNEVFEEGAEHLVCFNMTDLIGNPYQIVLPGSGVQITYLDIDNGTPQRGIGLRTLVRTNSNSGSINHPFTISLKHQPNNTKDGACSPGDTDVEIPFKIKVN
jgi:hypothetical protein